MLLAQSTTVPTVNNTPITMDIYGEHIDFQGYKGNYVVLEFFGTHCPMCQMELPYLKSLIQNNPDIKVIGVELQNTPTDRLKSFIDDHQINYPIVDFQNAYTLYKYAKSVASKWKGSIPLIILFDKNGQALTYFIGVAGEEDIKKALGK